MCALASRPLLLAKARAIAQAVLVAVSFLLCGFGAAQERTVRLSVSSPLATDGTWIYAVAANEHTLVKRELADTGVWQPIPLRPGHGRITGVAGVAPFLYWSEAESSSVYRIDTKTGDYTLFYQGAPLQHPSELAIAGNTLLIADVEAKKLIALDLNERLLHPLDVPDRILSNGPFYMSAFEGDLVVSSPVEGTITQLGRLRSFGGQQISPISIFKFNITLPEFEPPVAKRLVETAKSNYPDIPHPGSISFYRGIIYVIDEASHQLYALARHAPRAVRLPLHAQDAVPKRVLATDNFLYVLDGQSGRLLRVPRVVPTDATFDLDMSEAMADFYRLLLNSGSLPTRQISLTGNIEHTLRQERVLMGPWVASLEVVICILNLELCPEHKLRQLSDGSELVVPDLPSESRITVRKIVLDGTRTLGEEADRRIESDSLKVWLSDESLSRINPAYRSEGSLPGIHDDISSTAKGSIREARKGTFNIPVESVRYTAPVPLDVIRGRAFQELVSRYPSLSIVPSEEIRPSLKATPQVSRPSPAIEAIKAEYEKLLSTIHYDHPPFQNRNTAYVGVAENQIDCDSPDFEQACQRLPEQMLGVSQSAVPVPRPPIPEVKALASESDHGTMVAWLIGARRTSFHSAGLVPTAFLIPIHNDYPAIATDINSAFLNGVRIFNISQHFGLIDPNVPPDVEQVPSELLKIIDGKDQYAPFQDVLFVVAAGNEETEICGPGRKRAYPVCWGDHPNVLVVGASDLTGDGLLKGFDKEGLRYPGSNWSPNFVHVVAPGEGYHAAGWNNSYVPARGTSFSTPLVTATAALLLEQGILQPALIKQRIIATSDFTKDWLRNSVRGGILNVHRAVKNPTKTVLVKGKIETLVEILPGQGIWIQQPARLPQLLPFASIRRIRADGAGYTIASASGNKDLEFFEKMSIPPGRTWKFKYRALDDQLAPTGAVLQASVDQYDDIIPAIP